MKKLLAIFVVVLLLINTSCERTVSFDLEETTPKLVVEASIENGLAPTVILTSSLNYFSAITPAMLSNSFVRNAQVFISNGTKTHQLKEYAVPIGAGNSFYYYSNDTLNPATAFIGQLEKQYSLRIVVDGKEYTAVTSIPKITRRIDSLYWKPAPAGNKPEHVAMMVTAFDPPGYGDYIRYFTKRNKEPLYPGRNSVFDDQVIDGTTYTIQVERGTNRGEASYDDEAFFNKGDTVTLKLCNIDKTSFDFWRTMEYTYATIGNPFSSPTKVLSNIKGGLGYFGGYAAQYHTLIIPK
jgi:hypothetical protein